MFHLLLPVAYAATATPALPSTRVELPISMTQPAGGARRYSVTVTINGRPVEAALDTGSVGLRVLGPAMPPGGRPSGGAVRIGFNSGVFLEGPAVDATVGFGPLAAATVRVQRIEKVGCRPGVERCPASGVELPDFRIMGDGAPGQGFIAILGIGLREERLGHPLEQAGVTRWIVDLPRAPDEVGRLVLNPADDEVARYRRFQFLDGRNEVAGCITTAASSICAPTMIDSGAPGITVFGDIPADPPVQGDSAMLVIGDRKQSSQMPVTIGRRDQATALRVAPARPDAKTSLSFGIAPYLRWSILYDAKTRTLGVADR